MSEQQQSGVPPLDLGAVMRAREVVRTSTEAGSGIVAVSYLSDLLAAYDALAARHAVLAVQQTGGFDR